MGPLISVQTMRAVISVAEPPFKVTAGVSHFPGRFAGISATLLLVTETGVVSARRPPEKGICRALNAVPGGPDDFSDEHYHLKFVTSAPKLQYFSRMQRTTIACSHPSVQRTP